MRNILDKMIAAATQFRAYLPGQRDVNESKITIVMSDYAESCGYTEDVHRAFFSNTNSVDKKRRQTCCLNWGFVFELDGYINHKMTFPFRPAAPLLYEYFHPHAPIGLPMDAVHNQQQVAALEPVSDFIIIDCPGSHTRLSQVAHSLADTLITPLNDSFVDFDLLARLDPETGRVKGPSIYAEMVWNARQLRAQAGLKPIDWIVVRNRLGAQQMHNKKKVGSALDELSKRIGFRVAPGFSERVIFRELFPNGLTLLDLKDVGTDAMSMSQIAARQELRDLMAGLRLPSLQIGF